LGKSKALATSEVSAWNYNFPILSKESYSGNFFDSQKTLFAMFVENFNDRCKGPGAMEVGIDFLTDHVWQNWEGVFERTKKSYEGDIESLGMDMKIAEQKMLNYKRESDGKDSEIYELTRKRDSHEQELLTLQMDVQYLSGQKLRESELAEDRYQ
jgi:hypothetical protein